MCIFVRALCLSRAVALRGPSFDIKRGFCKYAFAASNNSYCSIPNSKHKKLQ